MGSDVKPSAVIEVLLEDGDFVRISIQVAEDEGWARRLCIFLVEEGVENAVSFECVFGDGGASGVAIGVVSSGVDLVFEIKVGHV